MASNFNKRIKPTGDLAGFLGTSNILTLESFIKRMWDQLYATSCVINTDGSIAQRNLKKRRNKKAD